MRRFGFAPLLLAAVLLFAAAPRASAAHALAMHGKPKYGAGFTHFDYVNPDAPKGGEVRFEGFQTFDNLNPFLLKGVAAADAGLVFDTLLTRAADEPFTLYGLLAESVETPADRSWVEFTLNPKARFHDGAPVTADDVVWTFETLKTKGHPFYRMYYASVTKAQKTGERSVKFLFEKGENRELPLIVGEMPVLPKHFWKSREFDRTTLEPLLGSGPYRVKSLEAGKFITYERVADYWGKDLPVNKGRHNFGTIRYDYFRDPTVSLEAFKAGVYDIKRETTAKLWATAYDFPAVREGRAVKAAIPNRNPTGMQAYVMNTRRPFFKDRKVREALAWAFDFESANEQFFYGAYTRTASYFSNSELASSGLPAGAELALLEKYRGKVPDEVFTKAYTPPFFGGKTPDEARARTRDNLLRARTLLEEAGWKVVGQKLVNAAGEPFSFEILLENQAFERVSLPFAQNLKRLGIEATVRIVDTSQYEQRVENYDFDMIVDVFGQSLSPGNEQRDFWSSAAAAVPGSRNTIGVADPVVDELIDLVIAAPDRDDLTARCRALDRVLLWGHYVIPHWHLTSYRVAYWTKFGRPPVNPPYDLALDTWWSLAAAPGGR